MMLNVPKPVRTLLALFLVLYAGFTLLPWGVRQAAGAAPRETSAPTASPTPLPGFLEDRPQASSPPEEGITLYDTATGQTLTLSWEEFLPAALACEMDPAAPQEALKAQAVALYTFYSYQQSHQEEGGPVLACDTANGLVYAPPSALEERWGQEFSARYQALAQAAQAVAGQRLTWQGETACTPFFAISGGATQSAQSAWGEDFPYLGVVASPGDCFASGYASTLSLSEEELLQAVQAAWPGEGDFSTGPEEYLTSFSTTPSGYVATVLVGGVSRTGEALRQALGLRSACFTVEHTGGMFTFTVRGWGHGVGMSQAGAAFLAEQGWSYEAILAHYYPGTALELP